MRSFLRNCENIRTLESQMKRAGPIPRSHQRAAINKPSSTAGKAVSAPPKQLPDNWGKLEIPDDLPEFNGDPVSSAFSEETLAFFKNRPKIAK